MTSNDMKHPKDYADTFRTETENARTRKALIRVTAAAALVLAIGIGLRINEPPNPLQETTMKTSTANNVPATSQALIRFLMGKGWTQAALADQAQVTANTIARVSRGESDMNYARARRLIQILLDPSILPPERKRPGRKDVVLPDTIEEVACSAVPSKDPADDSQPEGGS